MNKSDIPKEILDLAMSVVQVRQHDFPEDEWTQIGSHFELNLWTEQGSKYATLYKVVNDTVDSGQFVRIWQSIAPRQPVTEINITKNNAQAEEDEYKLHQLNEDARIEADWLARQELDDSEPLGLTYSRLNPHGVFTSDGQQIGSTCQCEDYPCCGH